MSQPPPGLSSSAPVSTGLLDWTGVKSVLLIRLRSIGDTVLMTPCLGAIKSWRPDIRITVISEPLASPLLENHPLIDQLVVSGEGVSSRVRLIRQLRRERFDVAFNLHGGTTATIITALSAARTTVGYDGYRYSRMLKMRAPSPDQLLGRQCIHSIEQQLALLCWAGVPWPAQVKLALPVSPASLASITDRLHLAGINPCSPGGGAGYAVLSPAASARSKMWPSASFTRVADYLNRRYHLRSMVIAGPGEESIARDVARRSNECAVDFTGLDLKELVGLIAGARVFIGNDSGPMHIAAALDRPLVAIFGDSNPNVWSPWTTGAKRVLMAHEANQECRPPNALPEFPSLAARDISRISVEAVIAGIDDVMLTQAASPTD